MSADPHDPLDRSLEQIEDDRWGPPPEEASHLVTTVHALRERPVRTLGVEELRLLLGQGEGVDVLVPLALAQLRENPLAEGDYYPGDLLAAVLTLPEASWSRHGHELQLLLAILPTLDRDDPDYPTATDLDDKVAAFQERHGA